MSHSYKRKQLEIYLTTKNDVVRYATFHTLVSILTVDELWRIAKEIP